MKSSWLILAVICSLASACCAQEITSISKLRLEYEVAHHGSIRQEIEGGILTTFIVPAWSRGESMEGIRSQIRDEDLAPIIKFFNDAEVRKEFQSTRPRPMVDGSILAIGVTQGSYTISFTTRYPFSGKTDSKSKLDEIAALLLRLAGLEVPPVFPKEDIKSRIGDPGEIILSEFKFTDLSVTLALEKLQQLSLAADPEKMGVTLILDSSVDRNSLKPITLNVKNVAVKDAVRYVVSLAGLKVERIGRTYVLIKK